MKADIRTAVLGPLTVRSAALTHTGKVRPINEDSLLDRAAAGLWAVADGMGGHRRGAYASAAIVHALETIAVPEGAPAFLAEVKARLGTVNDELQAQGALDGGPIASTVVCLLLHGWSFACVWAGDSRLYLIRDSRLHRISHDHSVVQELVDAGALSPMEAAVHPCGNEVTRAVGAFDTLDLEVCQGRVQPGDVFLLCSDGLTKMVRDEEILAHLDADAGKEPPTAMVESLLATVLGRGATDNVAIVAVRCTATPGTADDEETLVPKRHTGSAAGAAAG